LVKHAGAGEIHALAGSWHTNIVGVTSENQIISTNTRQTHGRVLIVKSLNRFYIVGLITISCTCSAADERISTEKLKTIKELMLVTGAGSNSKQFSDAFTQQLVSVLKLGNPHISPKAIEIVNDEVTRMVEQEFSEEKLQMMIYPIYDKYFTLEELQGLVTFNRSAVGAKANRVMPQLMQDSMTAVQGWSQDLGARISASVVERFKEEGIEVRPRNKE
jgi:hypothetical protein